MLFDENHAVTGEKFFGRSGELNYLENKIFRTLSENGASINLSITGMNRIGKSSLVNEAIRRFEPGIRADVYVIYTDIQEEAGLWKYWINQVLEPLTEKICKDIKSFDTNDAEKAKEITGYFSDESVQRKLFEGDSFEDSIAKGKLRRLLALLNRCGKRVLLFMDEFDEARQVFGARTEDFGWLRTLLQKNPNLSVVTISRRSIDTISINSVAGSTLEGIFSKYNIRGFSNSDIDEYYRRLEECVGKISDVDRKKIWYYCGRCPYYLAIIGNEIAYRNGGTATIDDKVKDFYPSFDKIVKHAKEENLFTPLLEMFVGPTYKLNVSDINKLESRGYCVNRSTLEEYKDYFGNKDDDNYRSICDFFSGYLCDVYKDEIDNIWPTLSGCERLLRQIITDEYKKAFGEEYADVLENIFKENKWVKDEYINNQTKIYERAGAAQQKEFGNDAINTVAIFVLKEIILSNWDDCFCNYFSIRKKDFEDYMDKMHEVRNPICHSTGGLLTPNDIDYVNKACIKFDKSIKKYMNGDPKEHTLKRSVKANSRKKLAASEAEAVPAAKVTETVNEKAPEPGDIVDFIYKYTFAPSGKIAGFGGTVNGEKAMLHISKLDNKLITREMAGNFEKCLAARKTVKVKFCEDTFKGKTVSLIGAPLSFDDILSGK